MRESSCGHAHASRLLTPLGHTWPHLPATRSVCPASNQPPCAAPIRRCSRAAGDHHRRPGRQAPAGDGYGGRGANTTLRAPAVHALPSCGAAVRCGSLSAHSTTLAPLTALASHPPLFCAPLSPPGPQVAALLQKAGAHSAKAVAEAEEALAMKELTVEEARERQNRLAKMRALLFYHEVGAGGQQPAGCWRSTASWVLAVNSQLARAACKGLGFSGKLWFCHKVGAGCLKDKRGAQTCCLLIGQVCCSCSSVQVG